MGGNSGGGERKCGTKWGFGWIWCLRAPHNAPHCSRMLPSGGNSGWEGPASKRAIVHLDCVHSHCAVCNRNVLCACTPTGLCAPTLCCVHPYWTVCSHIVLCESLLDCVHPYFVVCIQVVLCAPLLDSVHPHSIFAPMVVLLCGPISYLLRRIKQILSNQTYWQYWVFWLLFTQDFVHCAHFTTHNMDLI